MGPEGNTTVDHSNIRGSEPHIHDPSGAALNFKPKEAGAKFAEAPRGDGRKRAFPRPPSPTPPPPRQPKATLTWSGLQPVARLPLQADSRSQSAPRQSPATSAFIPGRAGKCPVISHYR